MRRVSVTAAAVAAGWAALLSAAPAQAEIVVSVSKAEQRLIVERDGRELYRWPVSTGKRGLETPAGEFRPVRFERKWYSRQYDWSPMPYSVFFHRGYAVHGTNEMRALGRAVSHGCVRLSRANASTLFALLRKQGRRNSRIVVLDGVLPPVPLPTAPPSIAPPSVNMASMLPPERPIMAFASEALEAFAVIDGAVVKVAAVTPLPPLRPQFASVEPAAIKADIAPMVAAAKTDSVKTDIVTPDKPLRTRTATGRAADHFTAVGDEASVLRGREAWLRSLDRKYGIAR